MTHFIATQIQVMRLRPSPWMGGLALMLLSACGPDPVVDQDNDGVSQSQDCDDLNAAVYPGATEICADSVDQDCNGADLTDCDGDGVLPPQDCNNNDATVFPGAPEREYDGVDQDCSGSDLNDKDQDGYIGVTGGGDDCDELDASIHPNASEIAYDGIDQDCSGADLRDVDGDGVEAVSVGGSDCDDDDDSVFPDAEELAYDAIDQDCSGADLVDVDGDGHDAAQVGGDDCADDNASSYPGATEVAYDGIDQDCADGDLDDVDLDGYAFPADCNDALDAIHPGATEVSCNGVDEDCDSALLDADCDGFASLVLGGADCNDTLPSVYPQSLELINGLDDNCDGQVDEAQSLSQAPLQLASSGNMGLGSAMVSADFNGDGSPELVLGAPELGDSGRNSTGGIYILQGAGELGGQQSVTGGTAIRRIVGLNSGDLFGAALSAGDLDGDHIPDLIVGAPNALGPNGRSGAVYIFYSASAFWQEDSLADEASVVIYGLRSGDSLGGAVLVADDLDGDGNRELLVSAPGATANNLSKAGRAWLFAGKDFVQGLVEGLNDAVLDLQGTFQNGGFGSHLVAAGDLNADGLGDVAIASPGANNNAGRVGIWLGRSELLGWQTSTASTTFYSNSPLDAGGLLASVLAPGDISGDGVSDLILAAPEGGLGAGRLFFILGGAEFRTGQQDVNQVASGVLEGEAGQGLGSVLGSGYLTDDDLADFVIGSRPGDTTTLYAFAGRSTQSFEGMTVGNAFIEVVADADHDMGSTLLVDDLDGTGLDDLVISGSSLQNGEESNTVFVYFQ